MPKADLGIALPFYEKAIITAEKEEGKKTSREVVYPSLLGRCPIPQDLCRDWEKQTQALLTLSIKMLLTNPYTSRVFPLHASPLVKYLSVVVHLS